ncbi:TetR/AcrR family transcriptional regulator [Kribbella sp. NPDC055071]
MPRVTQEHLDARRRQILDAAASCFARNGFHATSMPDIFAEAGLSTGAVYRYFPSKQAIIAALADSVMAPVVQAVREAATAEPALDVPEIIDLIHRELITVPESDGSAALVIQVWAEAARAPDTLMSQRRVGAELHTALMTLIDRLDTTPATNTSDAAWALIALSMGVFLCQNLLQDAPSTTASLITQLHALLPPESR